MSGRSLKGWGYGIVALAVAVAAGIDAASGDAFGAETTPSAPSIERVQLSAEGYVRERDPGTLRNILTLRETRTTKRAALGRANGTASAESVTGAGDGTSAKAASDGASTKATGDSASLAVQYGDHWVYDAGTDLLLDADNDGYYRYLRVHFDVDSYFDRAHVYAQLYTSPDGQSWDFYYETDDFLVTGATPDDAYEVESELIDNYPPNLYDVLVEIYDADTGTLVDEFGPDESSALSLLPLEDAGADGVAPPPVVVVSDGHGGGGSMSWAGLLSLASAAGLRLRRKKMPDREAGRFRGTVRRASTILRHNIYL